MHFKIDIIGKSGKGKSPVQSTNDYRERAVHCSGKGLSSIASPVFKSYPERYDIVFDIKGIGKALVFID